MSQPRRTDPIGSIGWTERTGGRRRSIDPASLVPPDSVLARDAEIAAQDLLTAVLLNHSSRAYTWGAAIAALHGITFDRELLYLAAMFHDTGIPSPVPDVDFTVRSAAVAREFTDGHRVPADNRELVANAIAMHHTPGVGLESGAEAYLLSAGASVDVFGLRSNEIPDAVRERVIQEYPRLGFKREFARLLRAEAKQVPRGRAWYLHRFAMSDLSIRLAPFRDWCDGNRQGVRELGVSGRPPPSTSRVAVGPASKLACAGERAEEVGGAFVHEPSGCAVGIHRHPANWVHGELALGCLPCAHGREEFDRLANVAQRLAASRLIEHPLQLGYQRRGVCRQEDLSASRYP
jgi:hypothetical protein